MYKMYMYTVHTTSLYNTILQPNQSFLGFLHVYENYDEIQEFPTWKVKTI